METMKIATRCRSIAEIDIHHNYAAQEKHFGRSVIVHRKGATSAKKGQVGIIPGSMGTASYIVRGKGNTESFMSCSTARAGQWAEMKQTDALPWKACVLL